jgi:hypothetical protein
VDNACGALSSQKRRSTGEPMTLTEAQVEQVTVFRNPGRVDNEYGLRNVYGPDDAISTIDGKLQIEVHRLFA